MKRAGWSSLVCFLCRRSFPRNKQGHHKNKSVLFGQFLSQDFLGRKDFQSPLQSPSLWLNPLHVIPTKLLFELCLDTSSDGKLTTPKTVYLTFGQL